MVNDVVYNYLKENLVKYSSGDLKTMILSKGYSEMDYAEALAAVKMASPSPVVGGPVPTAGVSQASVISNDVHSKGFKWIFLGFICGVILTFFAFFSLINQFLPAPNILDPNVFYTVAIIYLVLMVVLIICKLLVFLAFKKIGRYSRGKMLEILSLVLMIVLMLMVVVGIAYAAYSYSLYNDMSSMMTGNAVIELGGGEEPGASSSMFDSFEAGMSDFMGQVVMALWMLIPLPFKIFFGLGISLWFIYLIGYIFFSVGLIRIRKETRFALTSGILRLILTLIVLGMTLFSIYVFIRMVMNPLFIIQLIVSVVSFIDLLNIFNWLMGILFIVVYLFEAITLFLASRKFEKK